jgi:hypothetical protein
MTAKQVREARREMATRFHVPLSLIVGQFSGPRIRINSNTIRIQEEQAPAHSLVHWSGCCNWDTPEGHHGPYLNCGLCPRLDSKKDMCQVIGKGIPPGTRSESYPNIANFFGNITCLRCRQIAWAKGLRP